MAQIELLQVGCTGQEILDAINALIAAHNEGEETGVVSYNALADKPQINGVELKGNKNTAALLVAMAGCTDYDNIMATLATKKYSDDGDTTLVEAAAAAAQAVLDNKLDKDLSNIDLITYMGDNASILVITPDNRLCRVSTKDLASYTGIVNATANSSQESSVKTQRKTLPLTGDQNGSNLVFTCTSGYTLGTSALYLNGNRLYAGTDYREDNSHQITFLTYIPEAADIILFEAIPLADARV